MQADVESAAFIFGVILGVLLVIGLPILFLVSLILFLKTKSKSWLAGMILSGIAALALIGIFMIPAFMEGWKEGMNAYSGEPGESGELDETSGRVTSSNELCSLKVPNNWSTMRDLNSEASLQVGNGFREEYLIVLLDRNEEYNGSLRQHSDLTSGFIVEGLAGAEDTGAQPTKIGGFDALQRTLRGRITGLDISYLHTTVRGEKGYYQILAWTLSGQEKKKFPLYREIVDSFQEL